MAGTEALIGIIAVMILVPFATLVAVRALRTGRPTNSNQAPPEPMVNRLPTFDGHPQLVWGNYRLFQHRARYVFSDANDDALHEDWVPLGRIPRGHHVVIGTDGVPRIEREPTHGERLTAAARHRRS